LKKWLLLIAILIVGGVLTNGLWNKWKVSAIGNVLSSSHLIDSVSIKDGTSKAEILTLSEKDPNFNDIVEIYARSYRDLKFSERKLLKKDKFVEVDYLQKNEVKYKVHIYKVTKKDISGIEDTFTPYSADERVDTYSYFPEGESDGYIFALKKVDQLVAVNDGLKELVDTIRSAQK